MGTDYVGCHGYLEEIIRICITSFQVLVIAMFILGELAFAEESIISPAGPKDQQNSNAVTNNDDDWGKDWEDDSWRSKEEVDKSIPELQKYSLARCIEMALARNLSIKSANWELEFARERANEAWWAWWPHIRIRSAIAPAPDYNVPDPEKDPDAFVAYETDSITSFDGIVWGAEVSATQPLYTFGKIKSLQELGRIGEKAEMQRLKAERQKIVFEVKRTYYTLQLLERLLDSFDEGMEYLRSSEKKLEELLKTSSENVSEFDRYKFEVLKADLLSRIEEGNRSRTVLYKAIRVLTGLAEDEPFYLSQRYLDVPALDTALENSDDVELLMHRNRPEYKLLDLGLRAKDEEVERQWAYYFPDFFLQLNYEYRITPKIRDMEHPFFDDDWNRSSFTAWLGLQYTFDLPLQIMRMRKAKASKHAFEAKREYYRQQMNVELENALQTYKEKLNRMDLNHEGEQFGRKWMVSAFVSYNIGLLPSSDMVEAIAAYFKTQFSYHEAIHAVYIARAQVLNLVGEEAEKILMSYAPSKRPAVQKELEK